jgi:hypothetical protein
LVGLVCWLPFLMYIYHATTGIPMNDDYDLFFNSLIRIDETEGVWNKLSVLFSQHMEHRPAFPRALAYLVWKLTGSCHLKILILLGNGMLMVSWVFLALASEKLRPLQSVAFNLTSFFILCGLQSKENLFWATGALQNYSLIAFALAAIYFCVKTRYLSAAIASLLAVGCAMTGFLIIPVLIIITIQQKKFVWALGYFILLVSLGFVYQRNFIFYDVSTLPGSTVHQGFAAKYQYFSAFLGSAATLRVIPLNRAMVIGTVMFIAAIILHRNIRRWNFWTYLVIFVVLCALAGVSHRSVLGPYQALSERYKIFSEILFISFIAGIWSRMRNHKKWLIPLCLMLSMGMFIAQFTYYHPQIIRKKRELQHGLAVFMLTQSPEKLSYPVPQRAASALVRAFELKIFRLHPSD